MRCASAISHQLTPALLPLHRAFPSNLQRSFPTPPCFLSLSSLSPSTPPSLLPHHTPDRKEALIIIRVLCICLHIEKGTAVRIEPPTRIEHHHIHAQSAAMLHVALVPQHMIHRPHRGALPVAVAPYNAKYSRSSPQSRTAATNGGRRRSPTPQRHTAHPSA